MKYYKVITYNDFFVLNESKKITKRELREICNQYLTYLIDDGFKVKVDWLTSNEYTIDIKRGKSKKYEWKDVKNDFIPFLTILNDTYDILGVNIYYNYDYSDYDFFNKRGYGQTEITIEDIISDKINVTKEIKEISISLENKKRMK